MATQEWGFFTLPTLLLTQDLKFKVSSERPVIFTTYTRCLAREWSLPSFVTILDLTQQMKIFVLSDIV